MILFFFCNSRICSFWSSVLLVQSLCSWSSSCKAQQCFYVITALWSLSITFFCPDATRCLDSARTFDATISLAAQREVWKRGGLTGTSATQAFFLLRMINRKHSDNVSPVLFTRSTCIHRELLVWQGHFFVLLCSLLSGLLHTNGCVGVNEGFSWTFTVGDGDWTINLRWVDESFLLTHANTEILIRLLPSRSGFTDEISLTFVKIY